MKEGFFLLRRNRTAWFITQCMMIAAVGVTGVLVEIAIHIDAIESKVVQGFSLEAFLDVTADSATVEEIGNRLSSISQVENIRYVSREEAADKFRESMGVDLLGTLSENPLPPSFRLSFLPTCAIETIDSLAGVISGFPSIEEVVYPKELIHLLGMVRARVNSTGLAIAVAISVLAFVLTTVMLRLSIQSEKDKVQVMALLGASRTMIWIPFLLAGVILGVVGGIIAAVVVVGITALAQYYFQINLYQGGASYLLMVLGGMVWGFLASGTAVVWGIRSV